MSAEHLLTRRPSKAPAEGPRWVGVLRDVPGVDAAFLGTNERVLYVVSREHDTVDWDRLLDVETALQSDLHQFHVTVRAHQGRNISDMFVGMDRVL